MLSRHGAQVASMLPSSQARGQGTRQERWSNLSLKEKSDRETPQIALKRDELYLFYAIDLCSRSAQIGVTSEGMKHEDRESKCCLSRMKNEM